jgi:maleylpyruvate isomerase
LDPRSADDLVLEVHQATRALDHAWSALEAGDFNRRARCRRRDDTLFDVLKASWQDVELRQVDLNLGVQPSAWHAELCAQLVELFADRVPSGVQAELNSQDGRKWILGQGSPVRITGALTDLAAWLAGRQPEGPLHSSTGGLPELGHHHG